MRVLTSPQAHHPRIAIVCCLHGDERYGLTVFEYFSKHRSAYPGMRLLLANEPAIEQNVRYVTQDLNRSFPGVKNAPDEHGLAHEILEQIRDFDFVIDIHTTTSKIDFLPIVTKRNQYTERLINATDAKECAVIAPALGAHAMISHVEGGISLEYGEAYARNPQTLTETIAIIDRLQANTPRAPRERSIFHVTGVIPLTTDIPTTAQNFAIIPALDVYPILLHEKAYTHLHALAATTRELQTV